MARTLLLDTGVLVALVDSRDPDHEDCRRVWSTLRGRFLTSEGVLVEAAHLLRRRTGGLAAALGILSSIGAVVVTGDLPRYERAVRLMDRYRDAPMDFVDAMLVTIAEDGGIFDVLTLDRRGFETYRVGRKRFEILP